MSLGAAEVRGWSRIERTIVKDVQPVPGTAKLKARILAGEDPLGEAFCRIRSVQQRRSSGQIFTPRPVIAAMVNWAASQDSIPQRIVDPGVGSARYLVAAARHWKNAQLIGVDVDPVAAILARAHLAAAGFADRAQITVQDYRDIKLPTIPGSTLYIGNPPYVRHHQIGRASCRERV